MFKILLELLGLYLLYKLIFDFIVPVYNTSKQVSKKVNEMKQQVDQFHQQQQNTFNKQQAPKSQPVKDDYIDYEEVK